MLKVHICYIHHSIAVLLNMNSTTDLKTKYTFNLLKVHICYINHSIAVLLNMDSITDLKTKYKDTKIFIDGNKLEWLRVEKNKYPSASLFFVMVMEL